jgi:two-component system, cell cycle sensor histidine kinase and response regulator CckA
MITKNGHVLIVEDESVNAAVIEHQLKKLGYSVAGIATSGEEALELAQKTKPDVVLMDIQLEGKMDGVEAAITIRKEMGIPVVYLTGNSDEQTIERARITEAFGYLHKPIQEREVHSTLQLALHKAEIEARVRDERKWFATTLRQISDAVIAADATGAVKLVNPAAQQATGWKEEDAMDRDLSEIFQILEPETRMPAECVLTRVLNERTADGARSAKLLMSRGGTEIRIEESATSIITDSGDVSGVLVVFRKSRSPL